MTALVFNPSFPEWSVARSLVTEAVVTALFIVAFLAWDWRKRR